jgi:ribosomal protein L11 methyltransferase
MSWRVTLNCTRAEAERLPESEELFARSDEPPVLVAEDCGAQGGREPAEHCNDSSARDDWRIHAYFADRPTSDELRALRTLAEDGEPQVAELEDSTDWVTKSQQGLEPIRAGRFFVHTPMHYAARPDDTVNFEIDAGLAFGTGQHATTAGCLAALDAMERNGERFTNIADIGTGTGLLAFAALALWPGARCIATDIDPIAIEVTRDNAAINGVPLGHGAGELLLGVADGMESPLLVARAPYELLIANILAGPLIELAPTFAKAVLRAGSVVLAGLLDTQAGGVIAAYEKNGFELVERGSGEWPVLVMRAIA